MAICIKFKLLEVIDNKAIYVYGDCSENFEGIFELELEKLITGEIPSDTCMTQVVKVIKPCLSDGQYQHKANRAFSKIYKHYKETRTYLLEGGYYS
ncbi:hypothetical protein [Paenibacillus agilis]|uniref:Uncharacterized protein n=1 Tax=Paenibacillus agilis TaxID=3020863 RepID=A0A559J1N8_9BACL|nr:hypothetical protein [Paenibacillus agilis]TVX93800.1 hypothetical protein FPZ44_12490 [Paenibacillus agilis]